MVWADENTARFFMLHAGYFFLYLFRNTQEPLFKNICTHKSYLFTPIFSSEKQKKNISLSNETNTHECPKVMYAGFVYFFHLICHGPLWAIGRRDVYFSSAHIFPLCSFSFFGLVLLQKATKECIQRNKQKSEGQISI